MSSSIFDFRNQIPDGPLARTAAYDLHTGSGRLGRVLKILALVAAIIAVVGSVVGYFYWQQLKTTPQYSLALLIDASRRGDQAEIDRLVDTSRVVDSFIPQITAKAIDLYGRGVPNVTIQRIAEISAPVVPAVKDRARAELPNVIRDRTRQFHSIPFSAMVLGAEQYLRIDIEGDSAIVKSRLPDRPFEITMQKNGDRWQVVALTDEQLATRIAQRVGQDIIAIASRGNKTSTNELGIQNLNNILRQAEELFK